MEKTLLPEPLSYAIGSEKIDFAVKAGRVLPLKNSLSLTIFSLIWIAFPIAFVITTLIPLLQGKEVHLKVNGVPTVASLTNLRPLLTPTLIISVFALIGFGMFFWSIYLIFKEGGYFVGTPTRLVCYENDTVRSIDWEQFSGDIEISGNNEKGSISLKMRTGRMVATKNRPARFEPDVIYITDIPNVYEIEQICIKRIKENDPTPPRTEYDLTFQKT